MITVLLLSADPKENYRLNLDQEFRRIVNMRESSKYQDQFDIQMRPTTTYDE